MNSLATRLSVRGLHASSYYSCENPRDRTTGKKAEAIIKLTVNFFSAKASANLEMGSRAVLLEEIRKLQVCGGNGRLGVKLSGYIMIVSKRG